MMRRVICVLLVLLTGLTSAAHALTLQIGDEDEAVYALNVRLYDLGFSSQTPSARFTDESERAVREAQAELGLPVTGQADDATREALLQGARAQAILQMDARAGDQGPHVRRVQTWLRAIGLFAGATDGLFGADTEAALLRFQTMTGLPESGVCDANTRALLFGDLRGYGFQAPMFYDEIAASELTGAYLYAEAALLMRGTDEVLLEKNSNTPRAPASLTKLMTALCCADKLRADAVITVADEAADVPEDASLAPVYPGETMTVRDLTAAMLLPSGDDAARALAALAYGSTEACMAEMNRRAALLGMHATHFENADGYPQAGHVSTARDMASLLAAALTSADIQTLLGTFSYPMAATEYRDEMWIFNTGAPLDSDSPYYDARVTAVKTGFCTDAGYCAAVSAEQNGTRLIAVVLGAESDEARWLDIRRMLDMGFNTITTIEGGLPI